MVRRNCLLVIVFFLLILIVNVFNKPSQADSYKEVLFGTAPSGIGERIAEKGVYKLIEFWHYSGGYWKATTVTNEGLKEIIIKDSKSETGAWSDIDFLASKIYQDGFVLEYKIYHPQPVLDAMQNGAVITPVLDIDRETMNCKGENIGITELFNFEELPYSIPDDLPKQPEYIMNDDCLIIRALPKLNCKKNTLDEVVRFYPHKIPLVRPCFGCFAYAMYNYNGEKVGVGYSPDPAHWKIKTIPYDIILDLEGRLMEGSLVTIRTSPERIDVDSGNVKIGDGTFANAGAIAIYFWFPIKVEYYAKYPATVTPSPTPTVVTPTPSPVPDVTPEITENIETYKNSDMAHNAICKIRADERGNELFDVEQGIPVRENLYVDIEAKEYLTDCSFTEHIFSRSEPVRVKKTYYLNWKEDQGHYETSTCGSGTFYHVSGTYCTDSDSDGIKDSCPGHSYKGCKDTDGDGIKDHCPGHKKWVSNWVDMSDIKTVYSEAHNVKRGYSYWTIDHFEAFAADTADVYNAALPEGRISIPSNGISKPNIIFDNNPDISSHVLNDPFDDAVQIGKIIYDTEVKCYVVDLGTETLNGGSSKPFVPDIENYADIAEKAVSHFNVRNDLLIFNGITIIDNTIAAAGVAPDPVKIPESRLCGINAFFRNGLKIPDDTLNGVHESSCYITYKRLPEAINPVHDEIISKPVSANSVTVHTPVVCNSGVRDDYNFDQSLYPDRNRSALILGRPSHIRFLTTGEHLDIPGYNINGVMDCRKYTKDRQVRFPFDVYIGTDKPDNTFFVPKNTWHSIPMDAAFDEMDIFIPTWVNEGEYLVEFREIAVNAADMSMTEELANKGIKNYIAVRNSPVKVIGRMYGFKITDITDDLWWDVFRINRDSPRHTGNYYYMGTNDEDGHERDFDPVFTLPILEGSHCIYKNRGVLKTGYTFRFELFTNGDYFGEDDFLLITPSFYFIKKDGTERQEVDLWYHGNFNGKMNYFVKIEPKGRNRENPIMMKLGDVYRNVPETEIKDTADIIGMDYRSFQNSLRPIGWFDQIILTKFQRAFVGPQDTELPIGIERKKALKSVQKWYGEYYLPNDLFASTPGFDVAEYGRAHNGLDGNESFWLKNGYIIVNFKIETVKHGNFDFPTLSYWGAPWCNMVETEGFSYEKTDYNGITFKLQDGDILFYDTDKRSSDDYRTGGTH